MERSQTPGVPLFVFVHGFLGFTEIRLPLLRIHYFRGLKAHLRRMGIPYLFPRLPPVGLVEERAMALAAQLPSGSRNPLVLIGHSMGGLDARYFIRHLDPDCRVRRLVTIGTPHRGASLARSLLKGEGLLSPFARVFLNSRLRVLTPEVSLRRNELIPDRDDVQYISYAGARPIRELPFWIRPWARTIQREEGDNDGQVSVYSARWGEFRGVLRADHFELVGWNLSWPDARIQRPLRHLSLYEKIVEESFRENVDSFRQR